MNDYTWDWGVIRQYWPAFLNGTVVTITLTAIVIVVGTVMGTLLALALAKGSPVFRPVRWLAVVYVELLRALPVLVLLIWLHYVFPQSSSWLHEILRSVDERLAPRLSEGVAAALTGLTSRPFATAAVALSLNLSAFVADIVRSGIEGVPGTLIDAARSLGMDRMTRLRRLILPEALRASLPGLVAMYITMFKFTTLAAFIGCSELMNVVFTAGNASYRYLELYTMLAVVYLAVLLPSIYAAKRLERHRWLRR